MKRIKATDWIAIDSEDGITYAKATKAELLLTIGASSGCRKEAAGLYTSGGYAIMRHRDAEHFGYDWALDQREEKRQEKWEAEQAAQQAKHLAAVAEDCGSSLTDEALEELTGLTAEQAAQLNEQLADWDEDLAELSAEQEAILSDATALAKLERYGLGSVLRQVNMRSRQSKATESCDLEGVHSERVGRRKLGKLVALGLITSYSNHNENLFPGGSSYWSEV